MGTTASKVKDSVKADASEAVHAGTETLSVLMATTRTKLADFKIAVLDPRYCEALGFIPVDQVLTEIQEVRVQTDEDAAGLTQALNNIVDNAFSGDWSTVIKSTLNTVVNDIAGSAAGTMSERALYILTMNVGGRTHPSVEVLNVFIYTYTFQYNGLLNLGRAVFGYTAVSGSVAPGSVHRGMLQTLLNRAAELDPPIFDPNDYDAVKKELFDVYGFMSESTEA